MGLAKTKPGVGRTCWVSLELSGVWPELAVFVRNLLGLA